MLIAAYFLRPYSKISEIGATPSWALYCAAICIVIFCFLYWLIDLKKSDRWVRVVEPAATHPLITYILPEIISEAQHLSGIFFATVLMQGAVRFGVAVVYAFAIIWLVSWMNKFNLTLKL